MSRSKREGRTLVDRRLHLCVAALLLALSACRFSTSDPGSTQSPSPTPTERPAVAGLKAAPKPFKADPSSWRMTLTWTAPVGFEADHYVITRDTRSIAKDVMGTTFVDEGIEPDEKYRYSVTGVSADGAQTKPAITVVTTDPLPDSDARLQGKFLMKMHTTSSNVGASGNFGMLWTFDPKCASGPCEVTWSAKGRSGSGVLKQKGATYSGTIYAPFMILSCHGGSFNEALTFTFHITESSTVGGQWRATRFQGSMFESASYSGCVTGRNSYTYAGQVQS